MSLNFLFYNLKGKKKKQEEKNVLPGPACTETLWLRRSTPGIQPPSSEPLLRLGCTHLQQQHNEVVGPVNADLLMLGYKSCSSVFGFKIPNLKNKISKTQKSISRLIDNDNSLSCSLQPHSFQLYIVIRGLIWLSFSKLTAAPVLQHMWERQLRKKDCSWFSYSCILLFKFTNLHQIHVHVVSYPVFQPRQTTVVLQYSTRANTTP